MIADSNDIQGLTSRTKTLSVVAVLFLMVVAIIWQFSKEFDQSAKSAEPFGESILYKSPMDKQGTIRLPAMDLYLSEFLSEESKQAYRLSKEQLSELHELYRQRCDKSILQAKAEELAALRQCRAKAFYSSTWYRDLVLRFEVTMTPDIIGDVYTEVFTPNAGIASRNRDRVLINIHEGAFMFRSRQASHTESMPIAALGQIKVVAPDYRMYPEVRHPAGIKDVIAVYKTLLNDYQSHNIGIYGCSAGGIMTAQIIPWLLKENLPLPGAIGIFGGAADMSLGDSTNIGAVIAGSKPVTLAQHNRMVAKPPYYWEGSSFLSPINNPARSPTIVAKFPPSLLISSTRDYNLSGVVFTHSQLIKQGVEADLHVWEGLEHCFMVNPNIPESQDAYNLIVRFFDKHLGAPQK